ncbi:hypothetical protein HP459_18170 [Enterobacter sp. CM29]|nr:hypothetical protein [Enterobacter sp. CM29]
MLGRFFAGIKQKTGQSVAAVTALAYAGVASAANNDVSLPSPNQSFLQKFTSWMQDVIDFVGGAGVLFIVFVSAAACIVLWVTAPKSGGAAMSWIFRVLMGGIALFNLALLITWAQG